MTDLTKSRAFGILALRLIVGWVFLFAGIEKIFGAAPFSAFGFLNFGTAGTAAGVEAGTVVNPTQAFWVELAASPTALTIVNFIIPYGQAAIGIALILGLFTRFAGVMGLVMMAGITVAAWDFQHGFANYTVVLALVSLILGVIRAGEVYGVDAIVAEQPIVKRAPVLRYVLG